MPATRTTSAPSCLSAQQIADRRLAGLPSSKAQVNRLARAEGWGWQKASQPGGGRLYWVAHLPQSAQRDIASRDWRADGHVIPLVQRPLIVTATASGRATGRPKGSGFFHIHDDVASAILVILSQRRLAAPRVAELLAHQFDELPSLRSLQRFIARLETEQVALLAAKRDPDAYKGHFRVSLGRADADCSYAHQVWELDTTPADVMLTLNGRPIRMAILGVIDRWSRRAKFCVVKTESAQAVRRTLVETMRHWGVMPASILTDNGSGYINQTMRTALELIGIEHQICPPGTPEKKPHIERVFGTFTRERAELLDGYIGHNVADAQKIRARAKKETRRAIVIPKMSPDDLQAVLDAWVDGVYHQRRHSSLGCSPMLKWMASPQAARPAPHPDQMLLCLSAFIGIRRVGKRGIVWKGGRYWSAACAAWMGREVMLRHDEDDLGALFIFTPDGEYIDTVVNHGRAGLTQAEFALLATQQQNDHMALQKKELAAKKRAFGFDEARASLLRRDAQAAGKITYFQPKPPAESSPETGPDSGPDAAQTSADVHQLKPPGVAPTARPAAAPPSAAAQVVRADRLIAADKAGIATDPQELKWARAYARSASYSTEKEMAAAFAPHSESSQQKIA